MRKNKASCISLSPAFNIGENGWIDIDIVARKLFTHLRMVPDTYSRCIYDVRGYLMVFRRVTGSPVVLHFPPLI